MLAYFLEKNITPADRKEKIKEKEGEKTWTSTMPVEQATYGINCAPDIRVVTEPLKDSDDATQWHKLDRMPSLEWLEPPSDASSRETTRVSAVANLVSTIVGGGVLSLPFAFKKAGCAFGLLLMLATAVASDFAIYILCAAARRTGSTSLGGLARKVFGPKAELCVTALLFLLTQFVIIAFLMLLRDILAPLVECATGVAFVADATASPPVPASRANGLLLGALVMLVLPLSLQRSLHALRHACYAGVTATFLLLVAVVIRAVGARAGTPWPPPGLQLWPASAVGGEGVPVIAA